MTASAFNHPVLGGWMGDPVTLKTLGWDVEASALLRFWIALAQAQAKAGVIPAASADAIAVALSGDIPSPESLRERMCVDGVVVPGLVAQLRERLPLSIRSHLHHGATSQDVVDSALMVRAGMLLDDLSRRLERQAQQLDGMISRWGNRPLMAVTRLRDALPITVADRLGNWRHGLLDAAGACRIERLRLPVQFGGPVGTLAEFGATGAVVRGSLAERLDLHDPGRSWHTDRAPVVSLAMTLERVARATGKIGLDVGLMAQDRVAEIVLSGGRSSSMAHKVNPVDSELLVALARTAAVLLGGVAGGALHEMERSGAGWAQEWICMPQLMATAGASVAALDRQLGSVRDIAPGLQVSVSTPS